MTVSNSIRYELPAMTEDFRKLRENGSYYVDKTSFIKTVMKDGNDVTLITRPRRFGKTMMLSTFKYFLSVNPEHPEDHSLQDKLFKGTEIVRDRKFCTDYMGQYPVVSISLKEVSASTFEDAYGLLAKTIINVSRGFRYLLKSENLLDEEKDDLRLLMSSDLKKPSNSDSLQNSLLLLISCLKEHFGKDVVLLIDEYDVPLDKASINGYYVKMIEVIRGLLSAALKTNSNLKKAVMTGCLQVAKESFFTGLNNFTPNTVLSTNENLSGAIGFTKNEVISMFDCFGLSSHLEDVRKWYDGYRFGKTEIFCPWDIINNVRNSVENGGKFEPRNSWIDTSSNNLLDEYLGVMPPETFGQMLDLIEGGSIELQLNESMNYEDLKKHDLKDFWSLLVHTGYLTVIDFDSNSKIYRLAIPNLEIIQCFKIRVVDYFAHDKNVIQNSPEIATLMLNADQPSLSEAITNLLQHFVSVRDLAVRAAHEYYYHAFLNGVFSSTRSLIKGYRSNAEAGDGYADIYFTSEDERVGVVIEIKHVLKSSEMQSAAEGGLKQIVDKHYEQPLRGKCRQILAYGIAFCRKECHVELKDLSK